jgi:hypothetical protein
MAMATESEPDPKLPAALAPARIAEIAARAGAARWAHECAWVPGTGFCCRHPCGAECVFREQRIAEAARVCEVRRRRRPSQRAGAYRPAPTPAALLVLRRLLTGVFG